MTTHEYLRRSWLAMLLVGIVLASPFQAFAGDDQRVLVRGDGFQVTEEFVSKIEDYYRQGGLTTSRSELVRTAARIMTFAHDALETDLVESLPKDLTTMEGIAAMIRINDFYILNIALEYPLPEKAVQSFYHSNPEMFIKDSLEKNVLQDDSTRILINNEDLKPLDQELQTQIKLMILTPKRRQIIEDRFDLLKEKYNIDFSNNY